MGCMIKVLQNTASKQYNLTISQQQYQGLYSSYKNPQVNIILTFFNLCLEWIIIAQTNNGKEVKTVSNIKRLSNQIYSNQEELPHCRLRSISEQDLSFSSQKQVKLDRHTSRRIEQKAVIKIQIKDRYPIYIDYLKDILLKIKQNAKIIAINKNKNIGTIKRSKRYQYPIDVEQDLYSDIKQLKEKN
ncbi:hypothetical protein TTHERM_000304241 (macronuclear) [Tetrahymena thermophila SB210]|uniref:Uncharacterized protein n=1 Tax=Tetrahymena thermophila (strain SB210) TaxID=312017 RepID=W7XI96_TETTS|nr:hypothetical protein TTHERM_000304241 [Tetrahymena thermophila SB210]EWS73114.1 hypothetical protein TTHERM_000304241 [Tetrahymena thermophila SB210]|eukprot:XP_012654301.1 hypothetical protein TTHERM_000304241 [Tetrahymena thermophila SB210]